MFIKNKIDFKTDNGNEYIYCADTSLVFEKSEVDNNNISKERKKYWEEIYNEFNNRKKDAFNMKNINDLKEYLYTNAFNELILEVTTSCNLRCKYCIFSENYKTQRNHGNEKMTIETAFKAIKMYFNYYSEAKQHNPNAKPVIAFFGGEPLLNIDLIKKCLKYINSLFTEDDNIYLTLTTNGTLLSDDTIKFLSDNNVDIVLSLDGPKEIHDKNRVFKNNEGTFDVIMEKTKFMHEITQKPIFVNSVYDFDTDLESVFEFFDNNPEIMNLGISTVSNNNTNYYDKFSKETTENFLKQKNYLKELFIQQAELYGKEKANYKNQFVSQFFGRDCGHILMKQALSNRNTPIKFTGACVPGQKIFVDTKGSLYICEKVEKHLSIGTVDKGLDFKKILKIINDYNKCCNDCEKCPIHNQCPLCYISMATEGNFKKNDKLCNNLVENFKERLSLTYSVLEKNQQWFSFFIDKYYGEFKRWEISKKC